MAMGMRGIELTGRSFTKDFGPGKLIYARL